MKNTEKVAVQSVRWVVVVSVIDPAGDGRISHSYECRDLLHARTLLTELRDLAEEFGKFLPGLSVEGYELGEAISLTPAGREALAASNPILAAVVGWLSEEARP